MNGLLKIVSSQSFLTAYLSKWNGEIIKYLNSTGNQIISPNDITIQQLASYYGHRGGKGKSDKNIAALVKSYDDKWLANLSKVMTFIADEGRKPVQKSSDAGERKLANWISHSKRNNERAQLMRRDIPSVFIDAKCGPKKHK